VPLSTVTVTDLQPMLPLVSTAMAVIVCSPLCHPDPDDKVSHVYIPRTRRGFSWGSIHSATGKLSMNSRTPAILLLSPALTWISLVPHIGDGQLIDTVGGISSVITSGYTGFVILSATSLVLLASTRTSYAIAEAQPVFFISTS